MGYRFCYRRQIIQNGSDNKIEKEQKTGKIRFQKA
jgi:hypothetical protein